MIGPSEQVSVDFWYRVLERKEKMGRALNEAEKLHYPITGAHGISGDTGLF